MKTFFFCLISILSFGLILSNTIQGRINLKGENEFRHNSISVSLEGENYTTYLDRYGHNIPNGTYQLYVNDYLFHYDKFLIEVEDDTVKAFQFNLKIGKGQKVKYPLEINTIYQIQYVEEKGDFVSNVIKSPYGILIGVTVLMFVCMQAMPQDQLKAQFEDMNKQMSSMNQMFQK